MSAAYLDVRNKIFCRPPELGFERHKWAMSAALLGGRVSRVAGNVIVFGSLFHIGIELRSLFFGDGCLACSGVF